MSRDNPTSGDFNPSLDTWPRQNTIVNMSSPPIQKWSVTDPYLSLHCALGEAPYYSAATNTLRFVDIKKHRLHTISLSEGPSSLKTLQLSMPVGVTADIEGVDSSKKILVGGKSGIYVLDRETGETTLLERFYEGKEKDERLRSNDGAVDPQGRFWIGTMNDFWVGPPQAEGTRINYGGLAASQTEQGARSQGQEQRNILFLDSLPKIRVFQKGCPIEN